MKSAEDRIVRTPFFPTYSVIRRLITILDGTPRSTYANLGNALVQLMGTPSNPMDWSDPDTWIRERLSGDEQALALRIWRDSGGTINPNHTYGAHFFLIHHDLLVEGEDGNYARTERGQRFFDDDPLVVRKLDELEGIPQLLSFIATKTRVRRGDILGEWSDLLRDRSKWKSDSGIKSTLYYRLLHLVDRGLLEREGSIYTITDEGLAYAVAAVPPEESPKRDVLSAIQTYNRSQRDRLRDRIGSMNPYAFEHLVRDLLEAMGYEDVAVTKESGDRGVDVVATVQFGITTITEVVQVKRHQSNIQRPTVDQLRGALVYHKAIRGTIITTSDFSNGAKNAALYPGAAPITLIDGERLVELLVDHEIGVKKRPASLLELDGEVFDEPEEQLDEGSAESIPT